MKGGHQHITRGIKHFLASKNGLLNCFTTLRGTDIILFLQLVLKNGMKILARLTR